MNLPKPTLSRDEAMKLWLSEHSEYAKEQVILNNAGLIGLVMKRLNLNLFDDDLYEIGIIGLCEAINRFDSNKGVEFSTYAVISIRGAFIKSFRKKQIVPVISLDEKYRTNNEDEVAYGEMIADKKCFEEEVETSIIVGLLSERERKILYLSYEGKTQVEIAKLTGLSQSCISRILEKIQKKLKKEFDY